VVEEVVHLDQVEVEQEDIDLRVLVQLLYKVVQLLLEQEVIQLQ
tara:strand:- start:743 stop:874 length:132 start_codon:yes stop_codon:yes gene_type:complete